MSLDISFKERVDITCPHCGKVVGTEDIRVIDSSGKAWYSILENLGYYVPYNKRTKENDWYGKDMTLTYENANIVYATIMMDPYKFYNGDEIMNLIARTIMNRHQIVICADW